MFNQIFNNFSDATIYFILGAVATLIFLVRVALMMMGIGGDHGGDFDVHVAGDTDFTGAHDAGHDHHHPDSTAGFKLISILSVLAFFMGAGWMGLAARIDWNLSSPIAVVAALLFGFLCMFITAAMLNMMRKLNSEPHIDLKTCVGSTAQTYLAIPQKGEGLGQVQVQVQGQLRMVKAASSGPAIPAFTRVKILSLETDRSLVVEPTG